MKKTFAGLLAGAVLAISPQSNVAAQTPPALEDFARMPTLQYTEVSPDGARVAYVSEAQETRILIVHEIATGENTIIRIDDIRAHGLRWADNDTVILTGSSARRLFRARDALDFASAFAINVDADDVDVVQILQRARGIGNNLNMGNVLAVTNGGENVLIPAFDNDGYYSLFEGRTESENGRLHERGGRLTNYWVLGENGEVVARIDRSETLNSQSLWAYEDGTAREILAESDVVRPRYSAIGLLPDGDLAISTTYLDGDHPVAGLYAMSLSDASITRTIFEDEQVDLAGAMIDPYSNRVIGASYTDIYPVSVWFDEELQEVQDALLAGLRADAVSIVSWSENRDIFIAVAHWGDRPSVTYWVNWEARQVQRLGASHNLPTDGSLPMRQSIEYPSRDGTSIPAYLTLPDGEGPFPTILLPHGGPAARDVGGFDFIAHFLATRGYAVIQPNFRGSDGYGHNWERAGDGEWGIGVMQHDLTDSVEALIDAGITDADRVCIAGFSYGGYAALAGATFTPELYACSFAMAGVSDLAGMIDWTRNRVGRDHWSVAYWAEVMARGDEEASRLLAAASPSENADQVRIPVLLMHGANDTVVPVEQSYVMNRVLERRGADVEFVELNEADHWLTDTHTRREVLSAMERFFAAHIGD